MTNPVYRIAAARLLQLGLPYMALWLAWQRYQGRPARFRIGDAAAFTALLSAQLAATFVGSWPLGVPRLLTRLPPGRRGGDAPAVALTFDDGPDPATTPRLLSSLAEAGARATFFLLAEPAERYPDLVRRIAESGHTVALHGLTHEAMPLWSARQAEQSIRLGARALERLLPHAPPPRYFRPPYGFKSRRLQRAADRVGLQLATWSLNPRDYRDPAPEQLAASVLRRVRPGDIVLLHDARPATADALPLLLRRLGGRGFRMVGL